MKIAAIGDNVADCYLHEQAYYPGGNCVNVAVSCIRGGAERAAYIGVFGTDTPARHIRNCLEREGVDCSRSRTLVGSTGMPGVSIAADGDRIFSDRPPGSVQDIVRLRLTDQDYAYLRNFNVAHTSLYSNLEPEIAGLSKVLPVSYDFSDDFTMSQVDACCPYLTYAFFSGSDRSDAELGALARHVIRLGTAIVGITLGKRGAVFFCGEQQFEQPIKPANVVDAMGAGDHFIAGFLTEHLTSGDMRTALGKAAASAARGCAEKGGFGYPMELDPDCLKQRHPPKY